jgi:putative hydrolase of the HAD superfamily
VIRGVIFDLGSTLIRFRGSWTDALGEGRAAMVDYLRQQDYPLDGPRFMEDMKGIFETNFRERRLDHRERSTRSLVQEALSRQGAARVAEGHLDEALKRLYAPSEACWSAVPGVRSVLDQLQARGHRLGLLSNASDVDNVQRLIDAAEVRSYFDPIVISAAAGVRKPTPGLFEAVVHGWGVAAAEAVMVGDMLGEDILGAQRAGLHQIWVEAEADAALNQEHRGVVVPEVSVARLEDVPAAVDRMDHSG